MKGNDATDAGQGYGGCTQQSMGEEDETNNEKNTMEE